MQDNDVYGHVNNAHYYSYMDTVINQALIARGVLDPARGAQIGFCVDGKCSYRAPITYPVRGDACPPALILGCQQVCECPCAGHCRRRRARDQAGHQQCHIPSGHLQGSCGAQGERRAWDVWPHRLRTSAAVPVRGLLHVQVLDSGGVAPLSKLLCWDPSAAAAGEAEPPPSALGEFVHVFVARETQRPVPISGPLRAALQSLAAPQLHPHDTKL